MYINGDDNTISLEGRRHIIVRVWQHVVSDDHGITVLNKVALGIGTGEPDLLKLDQLGSRHHQQSLVELGPVGVVQRGVAIQN